MENKHDAPISYALFLTSLLLALLTLLAPVDQTSGDSRYSLLTSQAIWDYGSVRLDPYANQLDLAAENGGAVWQFSKHEDLGHTYYFYPVGTPLFSVPFVGIGRMMGMDMLLNDHDSQMQKAIVAFLLVLIFLMMFRLARLYLDEWPAWLFSVLMVLGTSLASTLGTALWSQDFQTLFILAALFEVALVERGKRDHIRPYWLGFLLFAAWLCRPTSAAWILVALGWVVWRDRQMLLKTAASAAALLGLLVLWSLSEYKQWIPPYYNPLAWPANDTPFWFDLSAIWLGPARGLFSFTPVLLLLFAGWFAPALRRRPLQYLLWAWFLIHSILIARATTPWGGWSYGPRFFAELTPGFAILLLETYTHLEVRWSKKLAKVFVGLSVWGIFVHTYQGLYNPATHAWNGLPHIDYQWRNVAWDTHYPQFLASEASNQRKIDEFTLRQQLKVMAEGLPTGQALLVGPNNRQMVVACEYITEGGGILGHPVFCSYYAMQRAGYAAGWMTQRGIEQQPSGDTHVTDPVFRPNLAEWLERNKQFSILLAVKDEGSYQISEPSRQWLRNAGSAIDSMKFRDSYVACIEGGKVVHENMGAGPLTWDRTQRAPLPFRVFHLVSAGMDHGNLAKIEVNGVDYSMSFRGFNCVAVDDHGKVVDMGHFDTHREDLQTPNLIYVHPK